jgi:hypothetical protein
MSITSQYASRWLEPRLPMVFACLLTLCASASCHIVDPAAEAANGCAEYAADACQAYARCGAAFLAPFGSIGGCNRQLAEACTNALAQPDGVGSGAGAAACGQLMLSLDCNAILNGDLPPGCQAPAGRRSDGVPCNVGAQCASARCAKQTLDDEWGNCRERLALGESCLNQIDCQAGMVCSTKNTCVVLGQDGQPCSDAAPCRAPLLCSGGRCQTAAAICADPQNCSVADPAEDAAACQAFAAAICARIGSCAPALITSEYGDQASCTTRNAAACVLGLHAPDSVSSAAGLASCTSALPDLSCHALLENAMPATCRLADGVRLNGQSCSSHTQCASTRCARAANMACGTCTTLALADQPCAASGDCSSGLVCSAGVCRAPAALGASCDAAHPCAYPLSCARGSCATALAANAPCQWDADRCDRYAGLVCGSSNTCMPWRNASAGQPCASAASGWAVCSAGASCSSTAADGGVCEAPVSDGSACRADAGPSCLAPALCIAGVCKIESPAVCP